MLRTMRVGFTVFGIASVAALSSVSHILAAGNLYVVQFGDGVAPVAATSALVTVQKYADTGGSVLTSIPMPIADSGANQTLTSRGNSTTEGYMSLSTDGQYLTLIGYDVAPGTASPQTAAGVGRTVGRITVGSNAIDTTTLLSDGSFSGSSPRGAASTNGTDIWLGGDSSTVGNGGARYTTLGSTSSIQISGPNNGRSIHIANGQLYLASMSGANRGVSAVGTGLPTTTGQTATLLPGFDPSTTAPENVSDFWFKDASTLYVADNRTVALGGGIQRWNFNSGSSLWELAYTLDAGTSGIPASGLGVTGTTVGADTVLYATNFSNQLVSITDAGAGSAATLLASAPTNTAFRGVVFVPSAPGGVSGDYNGNGVVDAADYVLWRNGGPLQNDPTAGVQPADYDFWKSRFGATSGSGSGLGSSAAVPEPASAILLLIGVAAFGLRRRSA